VSAWLLEGRPGNSCARRSLSRCTHSRPLGACSPSRAHSNNHIDLEHMSYVLMYLALYRKVAALGRVPASKRQSEQREALASDRQVSHRTARDVVRRSGHCLHLMRVKSAHVYAFSGIYAVGSRRVRMLTVAGPRVVNSGAGPPPATRAHPWVPTGVQAADATARRGHAKRRDSELYCVRTSAVVC
jgi:hypothetical protein